MLRPISLVAVLTALLLAACGAPAAELPQFPGATAQQAGANDMADALAGAFAMHIGRQPGDSSVRLLRVPSDTTWTAVRAFYAERLAPAGWQEDPAMLVEGDTFSYAAWKRSGETLAVGLVEDNTGGGAYLTLAQYR